MAVLPLAQQRPGREAGVMFPSYLAHEMIKARSAELRRGWRSARSPSPGWWRRPRRDRPSRIDQPTRPERAGIVVLPTATRLGDA